MSLLPVVWLEAGFPCAVERMLGLDCPGCGLLRSWSLIAHGYWQESFTLFPLGPLLYVVLWIFVIDEFRVAVQAQWADRRVSPRIRPWLNSRWILLGLALLLIQWIAKLILMW